MNIEGASQAVRKKRIDCVGKTDGPVGVISLHLAALSKMYRVVCGFVVLWLSVAVLGATSTFACETPQIRETPSRQEVFATHANIEVFGIFSNLIPPPEITWASEYAPAQEGGEPPSQLEGPPWIPAGGASLGSNNLELTLGEYDSELRGVALHHLKAEATYFARFHVENTCKEAAEQTVKFTTLPILGPELARTFTGANTLHVEVTGARNAVVEGQLEGNGATTEYAVEYAPVAHPTEWKPFPSGGVGTVTQEQDFVNLKAESTELTPETGYLVRLIASNGVGLPIEETLFRSPTGGPELESFTTPTARPQVSEPVVRNATADSAYLLGDVVPRGYRTEWRFEYAAAISGPWSTVPGAEGVISEAEASAMPEGNGAEGIEGRLTGLSPGHTYYVRLFAINEFGEGINGFDEPAGAAKGEIAVFGTAGEPIASAFATQGLHGEAVRLLGSVNPDNTVSSEEQVVTVGGAASGGTFQLSFGGEATAPIVFGASAHDIESALNALVAIHGGVHVSGRSGGPYTVYFGSGVVAEKDQMELAGNGSGLTPSGEVTVHTTQQGGSGYDTHSHFEYTTESAFETEGFGKAISTAEEDLGSGDSPKFVGFDLTGLLAGEKYRYRIAAANTSSTAVVHGVDHTLTVPTPAGASEVSCSNVSLRVGPSTNLPDCRAYEQVSPVDKKGSQEIFRYDGLAVPAYSLIGEDGDHVMVEAPVTWGSGSADGQAPYFMRREAAGGWKAEAGTPQPEAGLETYSPQVTDPTLSEVGLEAGYATSKGSGESKTMNYKVGPPGGPYKTVASVPREQVPQTIPGGWVAASEDFSKLVLQVEDRKLVEPKTTTKTGPDLYEYAQGRLHQVNVGIGTCGATIVKGREEVGGGSISGASAVSADGSRVFFEATPGSNCAGEKHMYERVNGTETVDLGAFGFVAATRDGQTVLLEKGGGINGGLYLYSSGGPASFLPGTDAAAGAALSVSQDLKAIYFASSRQLDAEAPARSSESDFNIYRYDVASRALTFVAQTDRETFVSHMSPDGRFYYFTARHVGGLPGGATVPHGGVEDLSKFELQADELPTEQVYRYDSSVGIIECVSCASPFDAEPKLGANFGTFDNAQSAAPRGLPVLSLVSANGDFAFFQTPADLIPPDVDGEVTPEGDAGVKLEHPSKDNSVSGDVYEWRADGIDGCASLQGCLALVTNGRGGVLNLLLGTANEGRDVFIYSGSQLGPRDNDMAGDIYDARVGGGESPSPAPPIECEGDACSTPASAPNDTTPASSTFAGAGNVVQSGQPAKKKVRRARAKTKRKKKRSARNGSVRKRHGATGRRPVRNGASGRRK